MRISGRNAAAAALGVLALTFLCGDLSAQGMPSFFKKQSSNRKRTDAPTVVEAATMDIDMENNIATLLGNVVVDDQDVKITCDKMVIHLEDKTEPDESGEEAAKSGEGESGEGAAKSETAESGEGAAVKNEAEAAEKPEEKKESAEKESSAAKEGEDKEEKDDAEEDDPTSGKQLKKIECFGEVVITHRADPNDSSSKEQVATSDYALYDVTANTITLTGRPVLTSGTDRLDAEKIVFDVETGRTFITTGKGTYYGDTPVSSGGKKKK
ncbi:MAG: hypothetical protein J5944_12170 [Lentisphaeria bacterium]|nr:hypothetical protein [Lentisphaeria bacterium]